MVRQNELKILLQFDVISFDIFDTLLLRPLMNPQDVWRNDRRRGSGVLEGLKG